MLVDLAIIFVANRGACDSKLSIKDSGDPPDARDIEILCSSSDR
jgi:hypothetical protein